ncbi:MAG: ATP-binding protein [Bacteroidota bacterium]
MNNSGYMTIAIASGKGGTGKTTIATSLAYYLSERTNENVALTDLDVEEPNSGLFMQGTKQDRQDIIKQIPEWNKEKCTLCNRCKEVCNFNAITLLPDRVLIFSELCHSCYACVELCPESALEMKPVKSGEISYDKINKLNFIEGKINVGEQQAVPAIEETKKYTTTVMKHGICLYDAPPGTSCPVIATTKDADYVILVTEPTPFGLHDLKLSVATMQKLNKSFGIIINRDGIGDEKVETFCEENNIPVLGKIPDSREIAERYSRGETIWKIPWVESEMKKIIESIKKEVAQVR